MTFTDSVTLPIWSARSSDHLVSNPQDHALSPQRRKTGLRDGDRVGPRLKGEEVIASIGARSDGLLGLACSTLSSRTSAPSTGSPAGSLTSPESSTFVDCA